MRDDIETPWIPIRLGPWAAFPVPFKRMRGPSRQRSACFPCYSDSQKTNSPTRLRFIPQIP